MTKVFGILLAAGLGTRLGASKPKAFVEYQGEPILARSYNTLRGAQCCNSIVVTVPESLMDDPLSLSIAREGSIVIAGGKERQDSVSLALSELTRRFSPSHDDLVLIHDAARCHVTADIIERALKAAHTYGAVSVGIPSIDSLKEVSAEGIVVQSLERTKIWRVQTPQVFRYDVITRAHQLGDVGVTDDASLVEKFHPVRMVMGDERNQKITTPVDLLT